MKGYKGQYTGDELRDIYYLFRCVVSQHHSQLREEFLVRGVETAGAVYL